ncbi:MAG: mechanosensitive ion channel domain-containing protein [Cyanobacteria bacterium P01_D01_bin.56]
MDFLSPERLDQVIHSLLNGTLSFGFRVLTAIVILIVGRWGANTLRKLLKQILTAAQVEPTLRIFACNIVYYASIVFILLATLLELGIATTSLLTVLGAAGLAIGLALEGALANFAAGILIIIFHPFRVGHWIEAADVNGIVEEIHIFTTVLRTLDNRTVVVPNSSLTDGNIINYTVKGKLRVDLVIGVAYDENLKVVKQHIHEVLESHPLVLNMPAPQIGVMELADSSVNLAVRPWVRPEHYWDTYFGVQEAIKTRFDAVNISIPFPQQEVRLLS